MGRITLAPEAASDPGRRAERPHSGTTKNGPVHVSVDRAAIIRWAILGSNQ